MNTKNQNKQQNKTKCKLMDVDNRLVDSGGEGSGGGEISLGNQKVQTSSYEKNKPLGSHVQHGG